MYERMETAPKKAQKLEGIDYKNLGSDFHAIYEQDIRSKLDSNDLA